MKIFYAAITATVPTKFIAAAFRAFTQSAKVLLLITLIIIADNVQAVLPLPNIGTVPFDHDKFLQFAESDTADSIASGNAYYNAVDPNNLRTTIDEWKTLNGFIEPLPSSAAGLAAMGITHTIYRNATDLGFIRNIYMRVKPNGDVVALLENYASFGRTLNRSADEIADACSTPFDSNLPPAQQCTSGGIDSFEDRLDLSGVLASVVMEYSAVTPGGQKFTQFYGYGNDGNRVSSLDLTGRGKAESFPGLCAVCHGGAPGGVDGAGQFIPPDPALAGAVDGNFGAGFLPFDPDLYEYHDPLSAGASVGSGTYSRENQLEFYKELNRLVLDTDPTKAARELVEGWYGGAGLPGSFNGLFVPVGWGGDVEDSEFYETVLAPYCRACHVQRAYPESAGNVNAQTSQMDFNDESDFDDLLNQVASTVLTRTTMPLALVTYDKFWNDTAAVTNIINYLEYRNYPELIPVEDDGFGNFFAVMPGKPIANPGTYIDQFVGSPLTLDGTQSLSADNFSWSVSPSSGTALTNASTPTPTLTVTIPDSYTVTLTVSNNQSTNGAGVTRPADTSTAVSTIINVVNSPFARVTFDAAIKRSTDNARCVKCHDSPDAAGNEKFNQYGDMLDMSSLVNYSFVNGSFISRLLYKPAGLLADVQVSDGAHKGGKILREDDAHYSLLKDWIEDGECKSETDCQRISITNENTLLEIDPLSPFIKKTHQVSLVGFAPVNGSISITATQQLLYTPNSGFTGLDTYRYLLSDAASGASWLVTDNVYVFPDVSFIPANLSSSFALQFPNINIPDIRSLFEFEKVNTDGDVLPNYLDDFPNNPLISRDADNDGLADDFNANLTSEQIFSSGLNIDQDDDNDGVLDLSDDYPLDPTRSIFSDSDNDGVDDGTDPYPLDMLGTSFEGFESGDLTALPWTTWTGSGSPGWSVAPPISQIDEPMLRNFTARTPVIADSEGAFLNIYTPGTGGTMSFWYFLSSQACCDILTLYIDGIAQVLPQTTQWTKLSFPVTAGDHSFLWAYNKDASISSGFDAAWIDNIVFSGPDDGDSDGASDPLDNCPAISNTNQNDADVDNIGDACDTGDADLDGISDANEVLLAYNPNDDDSDADGVLDGVDAFVLDAAASIDNDGDGLADALVNGVMSTSIPPLTLDLDVLDSLGGLDVDGDGVGDNAIYTIAGNGAYGFSGHGGAATSASLTYPSGVAVDSAGNLFFADQYNYRIRRVDAVTKIITTYAGTGGFGPSGTGDGGLAINAILAPESMTIDTSGNLFFVNGGDRIRKIDAVTGIITTVAGGGSFILINNGDGGVATDADLNSPSGLAVDASGHLFIADTYNQRVRRVDAVTGIITTVAGTGVRGFNGDGGLAISSEINDPEDVVLDSLGNIFIADTHNERIRRVDATTGIITTIAGYGIRGFNGDGGQATEAEFYFVSGLSFDGAGDLFVADGYNNRVRKINMTTGIVTTVAGSSAIFNGGYSGDGGMAASAVLSFPVKITFDPAGNLLIADQYNYRVRQVTFANPVDDFPFDPVASIDTDGDGFPDGFIASATAEQISATSLIVDAFPNDPTAAIDADGDGLPDFFIVGSGVTSPPPLTEDLDDDDDGYSDIEEIAAGTNPYDSQSFPIIVDGDLNQDGIINVADVLYAHLITLNIITPTQFQLDHGDVYPIGAPDGVISIQDLLLIQQMVLQ